MKKGLCVVSILLFVICCKKEFKIPSKKTDLENRSLFGKVKECTLYISNIRDYDNEVQKSKKIRKEIFTEFGALKELENYNSEEELERSSIWYYDENDIIINSISKHGPSKIVTTFFRDNVKNTETKSIVINDRVKTDYISLYGKHGKLAKFMILKNGDTTVRNCNYKFDSNNNVVLYEYETTTKGEKKIEEYKYDKKGNLIEKIYSSGNSRKKEVSEYNGEKLTRVFHYNIDPKEKDVLLSIMKYDIHNNHIGTVIYRDSISYENTKIEYVYDKEGNWIEQKYFGKNFDKDSFEFKLRTVQTREISYW